MILCVVAGASGGAACVVSEGGEMEVAVAVRQSHLLGTAFHPELTSDAWWHRYFLSMVRQAKAAGGK